jgi:hypothetical protein
LSKFLHDDHAARLENLELKVVTMELNAVLPILQKK